MGEIGRNCGFRLFAAAVVVAAVGEVGAEVFEDFEGRDSESRWGQAPVALIIFDWCGDGRKGVCSQM